MDTLLLSRLQFAANITFHILFPAITIALGWVLLFFRLRWLRARERDAEAAAGWLDAYRFFTKVFALSFALGVVSGVTMSFQFGTNWPGFMNAVGNVAGPLLGYEVLTAFFLEAGFLGIMLFGHGKVSERVHLLATFLVAFGTTLSAFWILALNSWMQTPQGHEIRDGVAHVVSWSQVIFNPSFPYRLAHMLLASALTCAFLLAGLAAWQALKGVGRRTAPKVMRTGLTLAALLVPLQIVVGDLHGLNTREHQPAKIAAIEALWETERGAPLVLFGWPDEAARENRFAVEIPKLASLILAHDADAEIQGLDAFEGEHPPVRPVFVAFRVMVGVGLAMLATAWTGWWLLRRRGWDPHAMPRPVLWVLAAMTFSGWVATVAGWYVTEIGRQPWLVHGVLRTADAVTATPPALVGTSFALYGALYVFLVLAYVAVLRHMASRPDEVERETRADEAATPAGVITPPRAGGARGA